MIEKSAAGKIPAALCDFTVYHEELAPAPAAISLIRVRLLSAGHLHDHGELAEDQTVIFPFMGYQAVGAVLDAFVCVLEVATAFVSQRIQRAVTEQSAEGLGIGAFVAGEVFTFPVLVEIIMAHGIPH